MAPGSLLSAMIHYAHDSQNAILNLTVAILPGNLLGMQIRILNTPSPPYNSDALLGWRITELFLYQIHLTDNCLL
jgi:hypothetical protein